MWKSSGFMCNSMLPFELTYVLLAVSYFKIFEAQLAVTKLTKRKTHKLGWNKYRIFQIFYGGHVLQSCGSMDVYSKTDEPG